MFTIGSRCKALVELKRVSLVVCPNGWGHFKRAAMLAASLLSNNCSVRIVTRADRWYKFSDVGPAYLKQAKNLEVEDCAWLPVAQNYERADDYRPQFEDLVKRQSTRLIISDNYPEPLLTSDRIMVLANFFWHKVFNMPTEYRRSIADVLHRKSAEVATTVFGQSYIVDLPNVHRLPLFGLPKKQISSQGYVVMAVGFGVWTTGYERYFQEFLDEYAMDLPQKIVVDASFKGQLRSPRRDVELLFRPFTQDLLAGAEAIIGRPSLGVVTDALAMRLPMFALAHSDDVESVHNARILTKIYGNLNIQLDFANRLEVRNALESKSIEFGGASALTNLIMKRLTG